jgi:hypothetical protein
VVKTEYRKEHFVLGRHSWKEGVLDNTERKSWDRKEKKRVAKRMLVKGRYLVVTKDPEIQRH